MSKLPSLLAFFDPNAPFITIEGLAYFMLFLFVVGGPIWLAAMFVTYLLRSGRFPLRDLFWLIAVAACLLGWWHDRDALYWQMDYHKEVAVRANERSQKVTERSREILRDMRKIGFDANLDKDEDLIGWSRCLPDQRE
jgi:hypothetical protein